jgi:hypothetical protein
MNATPTANRHALPAHPSFIHTAMRPLAAGLASLALCACLHCATAPPPAPETVDLSCKLPTLAPLAETKEVQEKGGIVIGVALASFSCQQHLEKRVAQATPAFGEELAQRLVEDKNSQPARFVEETNTPVLTVTPERLIFQITLNNKLSRVFRGAGTVVLFNVAGKNQKIDGQDYAELANSIVPPRTDQQVTIYGPPVATLRDHETIGLFLYDVVTKTNAAGDILEKQNFEWYYNYAVQLHHETGTVERRRGWVKG